MKGKSKEEKSICVQFDYENTIYNESINADPKHVRSLAFSQFRVYLLRPRTGSLGAGYRKCYARKKMKIPTSMKSELASWNSGNGIDLEGWICCEGNFKLAVGYTTVFWPSIVEFEGLILLDGFDEKAIKEYITKEGNTPKMVEATNNHLHIADIQYVGCDDITKDKIIHLGQVLKEIYQAKLSWQFPNKPCVVEFYQPEKPDDLIEYQITFWQEKHE